MNLWHSERKFDGTRVYTGLIPGIIVLLCFMAFVILVGFVLVMFSAVVLLMAHWLIESVQNVLH